MRDPKAPISDILLAWYDQNARRLPWRIPPDLSQTGVLPDAYHVWLSEIMLQQTTVTAVIPYFQDFTRRWSDVHHLARAGEDTIMAAWAGLGYYARARNLLKCARVVSQDHGGHFPATVPDLLKLPGIGPYTAGAISAIAFDQRAVVVDGNVERVIARLFALKQPLPGVKSAIRSKADSLTPTKRAGDFAQAMMDLGATICTPRAPDCANCPLSARCTALTQGTHHDLPARAPKVPKPTRKGTVYIAKRSDGSVLLERRPARGLLGGMLGWPGGEWGDPAPSDQPPIAAVWRLCPIEVRHTFTHFHLTLTVYVARVEAEGKLAPNLFFVTAEDFSPSDLPTVMRKAFTAAQAYLSYDGPETQVARQPPRLKRTWI